MAIVGVISHCPVEMIDHGSVTWFGGDHQASDVQLTGAKSLKCPTPSPRNGGGIKCFCGAVWFTAGRWVWLLVGSDVWFANQRPRENP